MTQAPATALSLGSLCARAAALWPDRTALCFDATGEILSFAELDARSNQLAHALVALGVRPRDRVAVLAGNVPLFPLAWLAIAKAGACMVPVNPAYRDSDAQHLLAHAEVRLAIADSPRGDLLRRLRQTMAGLQTLLIDSPGEPLQEPEHALQSLMGAQPRAPLGLDVPPDWLANVQFTSGTTGLPKGCMLSHRYWTQLGCLIADELVELGPQDVMLTAQPFSYIDPQWNVAAMLASGASLVVLERFSPSGFWPKVAAHGVSFFYCLGAMPTLLLAQPPSPAERAHRLRVVMCSGIPCDRHAELEERFGVAWREVYGTTETGADAMVYPDMAQALVGSGSIGVALPHRELRVGDDEARPLPRGQAGELLIRGTAMMDGYYGDAEATQIAFARGWYHTGDLATMDAQGLVRIVGRKKDMIRRSGENIAAAEVEAVIEQHPAVLLAAVIAVPDALRGEEAKAFVVLRDPQQPFEPETLASFVEARLARFKVPRYWERRDDLSRTASERVAKHLLSHIPGAPGVYDRTG
jgi:crotonobetaine/carnitine-CoA ligase